jgi:hypothetical protein
VHVGRPSGVLLPGREGPALGSSPPRQVISFEDLVGGDVTNTRCWACKGTNTTYALFSGGTEYYCEDCDDNFPYEDGEAPRRVQMIADGKFAELRTEMCEQSQGRECIFGQFCFRNGGDTACGECKSKEES